jgi:hypothetical protein
MDDRAVRFRWKDYRTADAATGAVQIKTMSLSPAEFLRRFLLHVLPTGFHRIRHYGLLAKGPRAPDLEALRALIAARAGAPPASANHEAEPPAPEPAALPACPCCGGRMRIVEIVLRGRAPRTAGAARLWMDSS